MPSITTANRIAWWFFLACILFFFGVQFYQHREPRPITAALNDLTRCFSKSETAEDPADIVCLRTTINTLLQTYSVTDIMEHINTTSTPPVVGYNCHEIGHLLGHITFNRAESLEDAYFQCTANCRNACIHGATSEAVRQEFGDDNLDVAHTDIATLEAIGRRYCDRRGMFCHAIGHFLRMSVLTYPEALAICDEMGVNKENCYAGVFMEDASAIESDISEKSVTPEIANDYASPCAQVPDRYSAQCFNYLPMYQNILFRRNGVESSEEQHAISRRTCESFADNLRGACFFGLGGYSNRLRDDSGSRIDQFTFCESLSRQSDTEACMIGVLRTFMVRVPPAHAEAVRFCARTHDAARSESCYHAMFKIMEKTEPKTERATVCDGASACETARQTYTNVRNELPQYFWGIDEE